MARLPTGPVDPIFGTMPKKVKKPKPEPVAAPELIRPSEGPGGTPSGRDAHVIKPPKTEGQPFPGVHVT